MGKRSSFPIESFFSVHFVFSETNNVLFCKINREEKSLRQIAKVAKFLDDNKPIKSLKSLFELFQT